MNAFLGGEEEEEDKAALYTASWEVRLKQHEAAEAAAKQGMREGAEGYLDSFHDQRTDRKLSRMVMMDPQSYDIFCTSHFLMRCHRKRTARTRTRPAL